MKATTQNILNVLNDPTLLANYFQLKNNQPTYMFQETSIDESYNEFEKTIEMIKSAIEKGLFETISYNKRNQILAILNAIKQHLTQAKQLSFNLTNANVKNYSNAIIQQTTNFIDFVDSSNLYVKIIGLENFKNETKELSKIKKAYQALVLDIENASELYREINKIHKNIQDKYDSIEVLNSEGESYIQIIQDNKSNSETELRSINSIKDQIKAMEEEIESKKLGINTFDNNIAEYKSNIETLIDKAKEVIEKENTINGLITSAENALNLKSTEGISAAFNTKETESSEWYKTVWWIVGAALFLLSALGIVIFMIQNTEAKDIPISEIIRQTITRIVALSILITGATFCAKQYIKQKNIAEDYAYKAVLSKSIVAFTSEIKNKDANKVAEYLTKVLNEIHKDPLRERNNKNDDVNFGLTLNDISKKLDIFIDKMQSRNNRN